MEALREQVAWLKTIVGGCDASSILSARVVEIIEELEVRRKLIESQDKYMKEWIDSLITMIKSAVKEFRG